MKLIKTLACMTLAALAAALLFQSSTTRADNQGKRGDQNHGDATVNFTKWVTAYPNMVGEITGGDVGDGEYTGEILSRVVDSQGVIRIDADYHLHGSKHSFTARIHAVQAVAGIGQQGIITGVITDGWLKGHAVVGEWTVTLPCSGLGNCFDVTLNLIKRNSKD